MLLSYCLESSFWMHLAIAFMLVNNTAMCSIHSIHFQSSCSHVWHFCNLNQNTSNFPKQFHWNMFMWPISTTFNEILVKICFVAKFLTKVYDISQVAADQQKGWYKVINTLSHSVYLDTITIDSVVFHQYQIVILHTGIYSMLVTKRSIQYTNKKI